MDENNRYLHVHVSPNKNTAAAHIQRHISRIHTLTPIRITDITMENAKEYHTHSLQQFYHQEHITVHPTIPHTPQENALAERVNRSLLDTIRSLLLSSGLPETLWDYALHAAVDYHNHSPHSAHNKIPITMWNGTIPDVTTLLKFGQLGHIHNRHTNNKLRPRASLVHYIGRLDTTHYHTYDPQTNKIGRCRIKDFKTYDPNTDPVVTCNTAKNNTQSNNISPDSTPFSTPKTLSDARKAPDAAEWAVSWNHELDSLEKRGTITYIPSTQVPPDTKLLPVKMVLKTKTDANGNPITRKTRCNLRGDLQRPHEHYDPDNIASPVADRDAIRTALAIAAAHDYDAHHWDIESAFLHEAFGESTPLYIHQPQRFDGSYKYPGYVGKITGNIYGAKQACNTFTRGLSKYLELHNFTRLTSESCTFLLRSTLDNTKFVFFVITIDDFLVVSNCSKLRELAKQQLQAKYIIKDLGPVRHILGWKIERTDQAITVTQPAYIATLLETFGLTGAKTATTPNASDILNTTAHLNECLDVKQYNCSSLVGSLRYLADSTRPDIAFITGYLGRFSHQPKKLHWQAGLRVLRYLKETPHRGLTYSTTLTTTLTAYSDSDFAACTNTRRSTSGTVIMYNKSPIAWQSKRQRFVAPSTWAAEYVAGYHTAQHVNCIRNLLSDLQHPEATPTVLYMDNAGAVTTANTPHPTPKSKHIDVKYHYLKEQIAQGKIIVTHIPSNKNAADVLTKALKPAQFRQQVQLLSLSPSRRAATVG